MDVLLVLGFVILILLIIIYLGITFVFYLYSNPSSVEIRESEIASVVTHIYLGSRGDMGNQIFQLACVIAAGTRSKAKIVFPNRISTLPIIELFDLTGFEWRDVIPHATFHEYDNYENIIIPADGRIYDISGYRQAYKYFEDYAPAIRKIFTPRTELIQAVKSVVPKEYIAVHIRKGDYVKLIHKLPLLREFKSCQLDYYKSGINKLREIYPDCPLLVCTDSPKWVAPLLADLDSKAILAPIPANVAPKFSDFITLYLAQGVVMSNSTYSFWAAYLNPDRTIICPTPWWSPEGFIGSGMGLDGPYLHHPDWWLLDADTGKIVRKPHSQEGERTDRNHETLNIYRLLRGMLL